MGIFSKLVGKKSDPPPQPEPLHEDQTLTQRERQEAREMSFEEGEEALRPSYARTSKHAVGGALHLNSETHGSKAGTKSSSKKNQELLTSSHAKRARACADILSSGVGNAVNFHALAVQLGGGNMSSVQEFYLRMSRKGTSLEADIVKVFGGGEDKTADYLLSIVRHGEPSLEARIWFAQGKVTGHGASQTDLMRLIEDADPGELADVFAGRTGQLFLLDVYIDSLEWLSIFEGKGNRVMAAVKAALAEKRLKRAERKGESEDKVTEARGEVVAWRSEQLCTIYHQRFSALKGLPRKAIADDIRRICASWDPAVRKAAVAPGSRFNTLLQKEMKSANLFTRLSKGTATYLTNLVAEDAQPPSAWFEHKDAKETKETKETKDTVEESETTPLLAQTDEVRDGEGPTLDLAGGSVAAILRELERKKQSRKKAKHLFSGKMMKWATISEMVAGLDDSGRLELLAIYLTEDERAELLGEDSELSEKARAAAMARLEAKTLKPAGMASGDRAVFLGAFKRGASRGGHQSGSPYAKLRSLAGSKLPVAKFGPKAFRLVSKLGGGEILEVLADKELLEKLKKRAGPESNSWSRIARTLNIDRRLRTSAKGKESSNPRIADQAVVTDTALSGHEAREQAADLVELRPSFWALKIKREMEKTVSNGHRAHLVALVNAAVEAGHRLEALGEDTDSLQTLKPMTAKAFTRKILTQIGSENHSKFKDLDDYASVFEALRDGSHVSAADQIRASTYRPSSLKRLTGNTARKSTVLQAIDAASGKHLLRQWSNYEDFVKLKGDLRKARRENADEVEIAILQDKVDLFTLDVNPEVHDLLKQRFTRTELVEVLGAVRSHLADAMASDDEFKDANKAGVDMTDLAQERTRSVAALDKQRLEDTGMQWSLVSGKSDLRKESRNILIARMRTAHETLREGKANGLEDEARAQISKEQTAKIAAIREELDRRTAAFEKIRTLANKIAMAIVGMVAGAIMTAIATGISVATFGAGGAPIWAAMLFAAGAAIGTQAVTLTAKKLLEGDRFNATAEFSQAALNVVIAAATAGTGELAGMAGGALGIKDSTELGHIVAQNLLETAVESATTRAIQTPYDLATEVDPKAIPGHLVGNLTGFLNDMASGVVSTAVSTSLKQDNGLFRTEDSEGNAVLNQHGVDVGELNLIQKGHAGVHDGVGTLAGKLAEVPLDLAGKGVLAICKAVDDASKVDETDKDVGSESVDPKAIVAARMECRIAGIASIQTTGTAFAAIRSAGDKAPDEAARVKGHAEALDKTVRLLNSALKGVKDVGTLNSIADGIRAAMVELDGDVRDLETAVALATQGEHARDIRRARRGTDGTEERTKTRDERPALQRRRAFRGTLPVVAT